MARYIDADALLEELNFIEPDEEWYESDHAVWLDCRMDVIHAPTADVAEVKHGEWIYHECVSSYDGATSGYSCSECCAFVDEEIFELDEFHKKHCGNCGAKMDGNGD